MSLEVTSFSRIRWKLKIPEPSDDGIESPKLMYGSTEYYLRCKRYDFELISLYLELPSETSNASVPCSCSVTVYVENCFTGKILLPLTESNPFRHRCIWHKCITQIEEVYPDFREHFELAFIATIHVEESKISTDEKSVQTSSCINPIPCSESLAEDLGKLLDSDSNPDAGFQNDGHCIKAHRLVASARSPVLAKMFQSQMVEGETGIVQIVDMDLDNLKHFVRYLYTGRLEEDPTFEAVLALYEAADKYEVNSLFKRCAHYLLENLSVENACNVLAVADAHSDDEVVEKVTGFILENKMPTSYNEHWSTFSNNHPKLAIKVYHRFCKMICK